MAADVLDDERYRTVAESVGDRGIQSIHLNRNPWPCGVLGGGESPTLLLGTAGIGYFYLRLYDSAAVPRCCSSTPRSFSRGAAETRRSRGVLRPRAPA